MLVVVFKKEQLKPTTQKLLADAPPRLNCPEVYFLSKSSWMHL